MDLVSIIIPVYNAKEYLTKCIGSVRNQTYKNIQIILIDDGSTDGSAELCDEFMRDDNRIEVIHKKNSGVSDSRNIGINKAQGKYIVFIDADDWIADDYVEVLYNAIEQTNAEIVACSYVKVYDNGKTDKILLPKLNTVLTGAEALNYAFDRVIPWVGYVWGKMYVSDIIKKKHLKFDVTIQICEDSLFNDTVFSYAQRIALVRNELYFYRINLQSATFNGRKNLEKLKTKVEAVKKIKQISIQFPNSEFERRVNRILYISAGEYLSVMFRLNEYRKEEIEDMQNLMKTSFKCMDKRDKSFYLYVKTLLTIKFPRIFFVLCHLKKLN